jgi:hypothetical protein
VSERVRIIPDDFGQESMLYGPVERLAPSIFPYLNFEEIKHKVQDTFTVQKEKDIET